MSTFSLNKSKTKKLSKEELLLLDKVELVDRIIQLETHTTQLKNIIIKNSGEKTLVESTKSRNDKSFDFDKYTKRRILLRLSYVGEKYRGLAAQEDTVATIEHYLFTALTKSQLIPSRDKANYHRCGRTDKGVSASGQVISLIVRSRLSDQEISTPDGGRSKELPYCKILNRILPNEIRAISWIPIQINTSGEPYSARFDCKYRTYKYWFPKLHLNIEAMREGCKFLKGSHDFRNFCKMDVANGVTTYIRHIHSASILPEKSDNSTEDEFSMYYLKVVGNAFLWHQIRCIVSILFMIGSEHEDPTIVKKLLDINSNPQKPQYNMAVELPLNLFHCAYELLDDYEEYPTPCFDLKENMTLDNVSNEQKPIDCEIIEKCHTDETIQSEEKSFAMDVDNKLKKDWWFIDKDDLINVMKCYSEQWMKTAIQAAMIKDIVFDLAQLYSKDIEMTEKFNYAKHDTVLQFDDIRKLIFHNGALIQGVKAKAYVPLLKRPTCETLENRIKHYVKKKRLKEDNSTVDAIITE